MATVLTLPDTILTEIFSKWLGFEELQCLDSAFCSQQSRTNFLNIISSPHFVIPCCPEEPTSRSHHHRYSLEYVADRGIKLQCLVLDASSFKDDALRSDIDISKVIHLSLAGKTSNHADGSVYKFLSEDQLVAFIHSFPELCSLYIGETVVFSADAISKVSGSTLAKITALDISYSEGICGIDEYISAHAIEHLTEHCKGLKTLKLPQTLFDDDSVIDANNLNIHDRALVDLIRASRSLELLDLSNCDSSTPLLEAIAESCSKLKSLEVCFHDDFDSWPAVAKILRQCSKLVEFNGAMHRCGFCYSRCDGKEKIMKMSGYSVNRSISESELCEILKLVVSQLDSIELEEVMCLSARVIQLISERGHKLKELSVICADDEPDESLLNGDVWRNLFCRQDSPLRSVGLGYFTTMTSEFLLYVFASGPNRIETLRFLYNLVLDTATVIKILEANPQLTEFSCFHRNVNAKEVKKVFEKHRAESEVFSVCVLRHMHPHVLVLSHVHAACVNRVNIVCKFLLS